jgi:hypothetical protein
MLLDGKTAIILGAGGAIDRSGPTYCVTLGKGRTRRRTKRKRLTTKGLSRRLIYLVAGPRVLAGKAGAVSSVA